MNNNKGDKNLLSSCVKKWKLLLAIWFINRQHNYIKTIWYTCLQVFKSLKASLDVQ